MGLSVAVVIPTIQGREHLLNRALSSVRAQTRKPDQVIVERDTLRTGAAASRTRALHRVSSDVIAWLDDDDYLKPQHLRVCMRMLEHDASTDLVYPTPIMMGGEDPTATTVGGQWCTPWGIRFAAEQEMHLRRHGSFIPITHLVRTSRVRKIEGFREGYTLSDGRYRGEDEDYLIRLLDIGSKFVHVNVKTWHWYVNPHSTAGKGK